MRFEYFLKTDAYRGSWGNWFIND